MGVLTVFLSLAMGLALGALGMYLYLRPRLTPQTDLHQTLSTITQQLVQLAETQLTGKQQLIDQRLATIHTAITAEMTKVQTKVAELDQKSHVNFATLGQHLSKNAEGLNALNTTTADLKAALANSRTRGQWGERMAEDVLKLAGLQPNIQYRKQEVLTSESGARPRPDFTFTLPEHRVIHMDVKFPMDNYLAYLSAPDEPSRQRSLKQFLSDVRARIRETSQRDYRNAATRKGETPLDYILIFIPNEQIYAFLLEHDPALLNDAVAGKVIPCSPTTLLAVLAVIHQAAHHFQLEAKSAEVFTLLKNIRRQWEMFSEEMDKMGKRIADAQTAFTALTGVRARGMDTQFNKLENLSLEEGSPNLTVISNKDVA